MKAFDYLLQCMECSVVMDEIGNAYLEGESKAGFIMERFTQYQGDHLYFISKEDCDHLNQCEITIADGVEDPWVCSPYYRMRGKPVTEKQAFDIIRRTDRFFYAIDNIWDHKDFVSGCNFNNWVIDANQGWIHTDGTLGLNYITLKYPTISEFAQEWIEKLIAFPYLDLIIAVTRWNEIPPELGMNDDRYEIMRSKSYDVKFYDAVEVGIYVHDKKIEILEKPSAVKKYKEYERLYGGDREKYDRKYYENKNIDQVDLSYLKRCIEAYGLDADTELAKTPEYAWRTIRSKT